MKVIPAYLMEVIPAYLMKVIPAYLIKVIQAYLMKVIPAYLMKVIQAYLVKVISETRRTHKLDIYVFVTFSQNQRARLGASGWSASILLSFVV
jgi:hypothetical protein